MSEKLSGCTYKLSNTPCISTSACVGGKMEQQGPMHDCFDYTSEDEYFGTETYEQAESLMQRKAIELALDKNQMQSDSIDFMLGGDLLNQCIGTTYGVRDLSIPFLGIYGACSTMAEGLLISSLLVDNGVGSNVLAVTSSHFCTAERQYRFPLDYGGQRTPTSQWTATASGALVVSAQGEAPYVRAVTIGKIVDMGVTDANNMGAAMAPAACETIAQFFRDTALAPDSFDHIVTGDLGLVGSRIVCDLLMREGFDIRPNHRDCGTMIFDTQSQDVHAGGSGCGCAASMLCGHFVPKLRSGEIKNILFAATGALMSPTINQQGESIPSIAHAVWLSHDSGK